MRRIIWKELFDLRAAGISIIVTTHVMDEVEKCDSIGMIRDGRLIALGSPSELKTATNTDSIEEAFLFYGGVGK